MQQYLISLLLLMSVYTTPNVRNTRIIQQASLDIIRSAHTNKADITFPLQATSLIENQWPTGYQVLVTIRNDSAMATSSWQASFTLPTGYMVTSLWNGVKTVNGNMVTVNNPTWFGGGVIPAGASTTFGMIVSKPINSQSVVNTLTAAANGMVTPPQVPTAPMVQAIQNASGNQQFTVQWSAVTGAQTYTLQQSTSSNFSNPTNVFTGSGTSTQVTVSANGTYYYRVTASSAAGTSAPSNVVSTTVTTTTPPQVPAAPMLQAIQNTAQAAQFMVQWSAVTGAQTYTLQQSTSSNFSNPTNVFTGSSTSTQVMVSADGTYYYRVTASSSAGTSAPSNVVSTMVKTTTPPTPSSWIIDGYWESWAPQNPPVDIIAAMKVDVLNISFANFMSTGNHTYKIAGVESDPQPLVNATHALGKKIKIAVGGATYPLQFQLQTDADARGMAQAVTDYVMAQNLDGVDWDIEDYPAAPLQVALLKYTRELMPNKLQTYTPKSPASGTYPYNEVIKNGHQYVDYISIMAYDYAPGYRYQDDVRSLIAMGVPANKIVVGLMPGLDDLGVMTSVADIQTAAQFIKSNGLKGIMFWDLNRDYLNITGLGASAATNTAWQVFHS